jgi:hypothetical protein
MLRRGRTADILSLVLGSPHEGRRVEEILKKEITAHCKGDATGLEHCRRRSTFVFRKKNEQDLCELSIAACSMCCGKQFECEEYISKDVLYCSTL